MRTVTDIVAANVARLRAYRALTVRALAEQLGQLGHPILASGVSKIENGERKVNVADLVALALALGVSPVRLMLPGADEHDETSPDAMLSPAGEQVALTEQLAVPWDRAWRWAGGDAPLEDCSPAELFRWLRLNRPHDDRAIVAAWIAEVEQAPGWSVERDECGRPVQLIGPNARPGGPPVRTSAPNSLPALALKPGAGVTRGEH